MDFLSLPALVWILYTLLCPFTKVEESFNTQAMHDVIYLGDDWANYDHLMFPGVVPRTFAGPLLVGILTKPVVVLGRMLVGPAQFEKLWCLVISRLCLGCLVFSGLVAFCTAIERHFGKGVKRWLILITVSQFHLNFYATRPLPNIFALSLVLWSVALWLRNQLKLSVWFATVVVVVFRCELVLLFGPFFLIKFYHRQISISTAFLHGILAALTALSITVPLDSFLWGAPIWPEAQVWYYNVVENKSHLWGRMPFLWYFYSALPRAMGISLLLVPLGMVLERRSREICICALLFVLAYSFLPHKELRFVIYVVPLLNLAAACFSDRLFAARHKSVIRYLLALGVCMQILLNLTMSAAFLYAAVWNYPGADALLNLHREVGPETKVNLHIDVYCAQTGVSRYLHMNENWIYDKNENLTVESLNLVAGSTDFATKTAQWNAFDYLLMGSDNLATELKKFEKKFEVFKKFKQFRGIDKHFTSSWPFVKINFRSEYTVAILKRSLL